MGLNWDFGDGQAGPCMGPCMGCAWHGAGVVVVVVVVVVVGVDFCLGIIPELVRLDSSIGGGLVGDGVEVVGVVL